MSPSEQPEAPAKEPDGSRGVPSLARQATMIGLFQKNFTRRRTTTIASLLDFNRQLINLGRENEIILAQSANRMRPKFNPDFPIAFQM